MSGVEKHHGQDGIILLTHAQHRAYHQLERYPNQWWSAYTIQERITTMRALARKGFAEMMERPLASGYSWADGGSDRIRYLFRIKRGSK